MRIFYIEEHVDNEGMWQSEGKEGGLVFNHRLAWLTFDGIGAFHVQDDGVVLCVTREPDTNSGLSQLLAALLHIELSSKEFIEEGTLTGTLTTDDRNHVVLLRHCFDVIDSKEPSNLQSSLSNIR